MPTLPELLRELGFINQEVALLVLFVTATIILIIRDWRALILTLLGQYIVAGLILSRLVRPDIAAVKVMIGSFICLILFLSVRQVAVTFPATRFLGEYHLPSHYRFLNWGRERLSDLSHLLVGQDRHRGLPATGYIFQFLTALLMILVASTLSRTIPLMGLSFNITTAVYWLTLAGLVTLILNEDPLKAGLGLFTIFAGFDLFYTTLEPSLLLTGLWGTLNLLIALALSYLIIAKGATPGEES